MSVAARPAPEASPAPPAAQLPRLLRGLRPDHGAVGLSEHLSLWGFPRWSAGSGRGLDVLVEMERAGLRGRGGAGFPTARKWRAVSARRLRRPVVVVNGAEAEPASHKDRLLLGRVPHLVLDGAELAAAAVGAGRLVAYVAPALVGPVSAAVEERRRMGLGRLRIEVVEAATCFLAGEESAVVAHVNGGPGGVPTFKGITPVYQRGVGGQPTLVQNAETLAHVALIARFGAAWFRAVGTPESPGSALVTLSCPGAGPRVMEVSLGDRLGAILASAGVGPASTAGVLLGGFGGTWVSATAAADLPLAEEALGPVGATLGAGVVGVLPREACPLAETAHIAAYMQTQGAGQCGPCVHGLPAIAGALAVLAWGRGARADAARRLDQVCGQVPGRGACHHPDGVVRMVRSAMSVFSEHVAWHLRHGACPGASAGPSLPVPLSRGSWT